MTKDDFMVIDFSPTGVVTAMHRDEFSLGFLGKQSIERASEIKFDEATQLWDVYLPDDGHCWNIVDEAKGFTGYNEARKFEVAWLEHCALGSVAPLSDAGRAVAAAIRMPAPAAQIRGLDDIFWPGLAP